MSPLLVEYIRRLKSSHILTARNARKLLSSCIHEAGHWMAFAHYKVPIIYAEVKRGSNCGCGIVQPVDLTCLVPEEMKVEVECVASLAGAGAQYALIPFMDMENIRFGSQKDGRDFRRVLDNEFGSNCDARKSFREKCVPIADQIIRQNWPVVEALANELMVKGKICFGKTEAVEKRYGVGRHDFTHPRLQSAQRRLGAFHSSPAELLKSLIANDKWNIK